MTPYDEQTLSFDIADQPRRGVLRTPKELAERAGLLINLAADCEQSLDGECFRIVPEIFLAAGHRVATFDLPNHGPRVNEYGAGLDGWAAAARSGTDVFADIRETGTALIDVCLQQGSITEGAIVVSGTSRGGIAALHLMAAVPRIVAAAVQWPVTHLPALREFSGTSDNAIVQRANAEALIPALAGRHVFVAIGSVDPRIDAVSCHRFFEQLDASSGTVKPELFTGPGATHAKSCDPSIPRFPMATAYDASAAFLLSCIPRVS